MPSVVDGDPACLRASPIFRADRVLPVGQVREKDRSLRLAIDDEASRRIDDLQMHVRNKFGVLGFAAA